MSDLEARPVAVSAGEMAVFEAGEGKPILFLHGIPTGRHLFRNIAPLLAPAGRVIVPDLLGYGDSEKPKEADLSVVAQAGYVRELLDHLGVEEAAVVGHDLGTGIAQLLALEGRAAAIVLTNGITFDGWPVHGVQLLREMPEDQWTDEVAENVVRVAFQTGMARSELAEEDLDEYLRPWRGEPAALGRAFRAVDGEGLTGTEEALAALELPAFVLWGEEDPYQGPENAERLGEILPRSTTATLPGVSHYLTEDAPETVGPLIAQWLRSVYLEGRPRGEPIPPEELGISFERPAGPPGDLPDE